MFGLAEQRAGFAVYGYVRRGQKEGDANFTVKKGKHHERGRLETKAQEKI